MTVSLAAQRSLHDRVRDEIAARIRSGELTPGARLRSERELATTFGASRDTVRRALGALEREGLLHTAPGSGRFVAEAALTEPPNTLLSFTDLGAQRGLRATARVLRCRVRAATLEEAELAGIAPGADLFELERLRMLDGIPVALDHTRVPLAVAPKLPETDFRTASLYDTLDRAGAGVVRADYTTEACAASAPQARQLGLHPGEPLLRARTQGFDGAGRVVELGDTFYRGDRYRFHATLVRERQPGRGGRQ